MNEATSSQNEPTEVDNLYRRLAALDSRRPGEWVRRKVQAYSAQQAAERALRESAEGSGKPVAAAVQTPTPTQTPTSRVTPAAPVARAVPAEKKMAGKSFLLILICATVAVVALVGF